MYILYKHIHTLAFAGSTLSQARAVRGERRKSEWKREDDRLARCVMKALVFVLGVEIERVCVCGWFTLGTMKPTRDGTCLRRINKHATQP